MVVNISISQKHELIKTLLILQDRVDNRFDETAWEIAWKGVFQAHESSTLARPKCNNTVHDDASICQPQKPTCQIEKIPIGF
jgi:hypothetical protein